MRNAHRHVAIDAEFLQPTREPVGAPIQLIVTQLSFAKDEREAAGVRARLFFEELVNRGVRAGNSVRVSFHSTRSFFRSSSLQQRQRIERLRRIGDDRLEQMCGNARASAGSSPHRKGRCCNCR